MNTKRKQTKQDVTFSPPLLAAAATEPALALEGEEGVGIAAAAAAAAEPAEPALPGVGEACVLAPFA